MFKTRPASAAFTRASISAPPRKSAASARPWGSKLMPRQDTQPQGDLQFVAPPRNRCVSAPLFFSASSNSPFFRITTRLPLATIFADIRIAVPAVSCSNPLHLQLHTHPFSQAHPASLATMTVLSRSRKLMIVIAISLAFFLAEISGKYCPLGSPIVRANTSQSASTLARSLSWLMPSIT